ncbi:MAG: carboxypeptidase regulatory-like domain-containing protein [Acidobacteria bacterium]|nr:carboxypeptidase regulatory-like domain-containing protein [Acidobacteriota bacterium]MBV9435606.1 carboxypeptidase regulatory-like domain-containing protein [Acidobacteriota bacterium]
MPPSPPDTQQAAPPQHVLSGTVVNAQTGAPIPYALVQAEQSAKLTDQNGNFRFDNLVSMSLMVQAHKPGFFNDQELAQMRPVPPSMVTLSDKPTNVTIALTPEAVITGHVENPEGEPLGGMPVRLRFAQIVNGRRMWQQHGFHQTDEDGDFRIAELRPGTYYVEVGPNSRARPIPQQGGPEKFEVVAAEYYPGVREMSSATPIQLAAGQKLALNFGMKRVPAFHIGGAVVGGAMNGGLMLLDRDGENTNVGIRFDSSTGRFQAFPVPSGSYRLHFSGHDNDGQQLFADVPITVGADIPELRVPLGRTVDIPLEVEAEFTKQNPGQSQGFVTSGVGIGSGAGIGRPFYGQVRLISRTASNRQYFTTRTEAGELIKAVEPGTYDVEVDTNGLSYVASATYAGVDLLREPLVIAEGAAQQPIHVVLRDDGASVTGAVQAPDGSKSGLVLMIPEGDASSTPRQVYVDQSGNFHAQGIAPGSYDILAFDRVDGLEYRNREALNGYLSHAAHVTLGADEQAKVTVDLIQTK